MVMCTASAELAPQASARLLNVAGLHCRNREHSRSVDIEAQRRVWGIPSRRRRDPNGYQTEGSMPSDFPRSPKILKGALAVFSSQKPGPAPTIIVFQYNPEQLSRSLAHRAAPPDPRNVGGVRENSFKEGSR